MTTVDEIEKLTYSLTEVQRADLAARLLESLNPTLYEEDDGVAEAIRRRAEMDVDPSASITTEELDEHLRELLK